MAKSALDLFKQAYKGGPKQTKTVPVASKKPLSTAQKIIKGFMNPLGLAGAVDKKVAGVGAKKGAPKQINGQKLRSVKGVPVRESKVIGPLADDADSLLAEAYKKKVSPITSKLTHQPKYKLSVDVGNRWAGKDMVRPKINSAKLSVKKK